MGQPDTLLAGWRQIRGSGMRGWQFVLGAGAADRGKEPFGGLVLADVGVGARVVSLSASSWIIVEAMDDEGALTGDECEGGQPVWGRLTESLVRGPDGEPRFGISTIEDIDQRKRAEAALRVSENRFRTMFERAPFVTLICASNGDLLHANQAYQQPRWSAPERVASLQRAAGRATGDGWTATLHRARLRRRGDGGAATALRPTADGRPTIGARPLAEAGLTEMRTLIFELRPESLEAEGLVVAPYPRPSATSRTCRSRSRRPSTVSRGKPCTTSSSMRAHNVELRLAHDAEQIVLRVADGGVGFDTGRSFPGHLGLRSMRERATRLSGKLFITSEPGQGACLSVAIPRPPN